MHPDGKWSILSAMRKATQQADRRSLRRADAGAAGDAVDARGPERFRQTHRRQGGGAPPRRRSGEDPTLSRERHNLTFQRVAQARVMVRSLFTALDSFSPPPRRGGPAG